MNRYTYDGPVMVFDRLASNRWRGETVAPSKRKARSNLAYQFKKQANMMPGMVVTLPGAITMVG